MSDPEKPEVPTKPKRDPAALSSEYHKAHKQLMLWAMILFIWEFVGVDLAKAKEAGGYIGPIINALRSPQAVPWVLLALVFYFLFKCSTEWAQCHADRRNLRFARVDFVSAWIVAIAAVVLYVGQALSRVQLADFLQKNAVWALSFGIGFVMVFPTMPIADLILEWKRLSKVSRALGIIVPVFSVASFALAMWITSRYGGVSLNWRVVLIGALVGLPAVAALRFVGMQTVDSVNQFAEKVIRLPKKPPRNPTY